MRSCVDGTVAVWFVPAMRRAARDRLDELSSNCPLRTDEVSAMTGIPVGTLRYYRNRGEGPPSYKLGGTVVYDREPLQEWWDEQRRSTSSTRPSNA